jgi:hypothetical protein
VTGRTANGLTRRLDETQVRCVVCEETLHFLPDSYPLAFHCENGHFWTVQDLLDEFMPLGKTPPPSALEYWQRVSRQFHDLAARAHQGGHTLVAADFQETAVRIDEWERALRRLLAAGAPASTCPEPKPGDAGPVSA